MNVKCSLVYVCTSFTDVHVTDRTQQCGGELLSCCSVSFFVEASTRFARFFLAGKHQVEAVRIGEIHRPCTRLCAARASYLFGAVVIEPL